MALPPQVVVDTPLTSSNRDPSAVRLEGSPVPATRHLSASPETGSLSPLEASNRSTLMRQFNRRFPPFYSQFASSEVQLQNLQLAYTLYQTRQVVVQMREEHHKTVLLFAYNNYPAVLRDVFGSIAAFNLTLHNIQLYGQIEAPRLVFLRLTLSRDSKPLPLATSLNLERAIHECLGGRFNVEDTLALEFNLQEKLQSATVRYYLDRVFHLPALLIEADTEPSLFYKVASALCNEKLTVVGVTSMPRRGQMRLICYLLGPNGSTTIPDYLGQKWATAIGSRLGAEV